MSADFVPGLPGVTISAPPLAFAPARSPAQSTSFFWRRRPLFWLAIACCVGIACDAAAAPRPPLLAVLCLVVVAATVRVLVAWRRPTVPRSSGLRDDAAASRMLGVALCGLAVALAGGMAVHAVRARVPPPRDVSRCTPNLPCFVLLRGTVVGVARSAAPVPAGNASASQAAARETWTVALEALGADALRPTSGCVRLKAPTVSPAGPDGGTAPPESVGEGDRIELRARLEELPVLTLPDSFDYGAYLRGQGIRRLGVVFPGSVKVLSGPRWHRPDLMLRRASSALAERVEALLPDASVTGRRAGSQAALLNALLFGRRERVDVSDREAFTASGTAHLLAISGLQMQFLAWLLWHAVGLLGLTRRKSAWLVMLFSCAYCALAGSDPPMTRATVMIVLYLAATVCWREPDPLSILGAAALAILFVSPQELFNAGFQLSFLAVLALLTVYPTLNEAWAAWRSRTVSLPGAVTVGGWWRTATGRLLGALRVSLFVSFAAWVGTAPVVAWHMGRFPSYSLVVNLVAVPLSSLCMVGGLAMLVAGLFSTTLAALPGWAAWAGVVLLQRLNEAVAGVPGANIDVPGPALPVVLLYGGAVAWVWIDRGRVLKLPAAAAVLAACLLTLPAGLLVGRTDSSTYGGRTNSSTYGGRTNSSTYTVLDLRYGHAALIEAPGARVMLDAGGPGEGGALAELLRRRGVSALDLLVLSADDVEAIGGAAALVARVRVAHVLFPRAGSPSAARRELEDVLAEKGVPYGTGVGGLGVPPAVTLGGVRLEFCDDGPPPGVPAPTQSVLSVRVTLRPGNSTAPSTGGTPVPREGTSVLFVHARSSASLRRMIANAQAGALAGGTGVSRPPAAFLKADVLRLLPGPGGHWPAETAELIERSSCGVVIAGAGSDLDTCTGLDLAELARERHLTLLSPGRDGSVLVQPGGPGPELHAFCDGEWRRIGY